MYLTYKSVLSLLREVFKDENGSNPYERFMMDEPTTKTYRMLYNAYQSDYVAKTNYYQSVNDIAYQILLRCMEVYLSSKGTYRYPPLSLPGTESPEQYVERLLRWLSMV